MKYHSTILILPGLGNSGDKHWQTTWEKHYPEFIRVNQKDWETPVCNDWIETIDKQVTAHNISQVILVAHSLACSTVSFWADRYQRKIKGALLVAPSDTEAATYPSGTSGFSPISSQKLPFYSIVVTSSNDYYVTLQRAAFFAQNWGSEFVNIGEAGHINVAAGFGEWPFGLELLHKIDNLR